jgi:hypothetical protein
MRKVLPVFIVLAALAVPARFSAQAPAAPPQGFPPQGRGGVGLRGPARDNAQRPTGTAVIRGRVVSADTGAAVRRAQVRATSSVSRDNRIVSTDSQGNFEFRDLPAGRWDVSASKAGFVTMRFGQRRPFEAGRPLEVADAQVVEKVTLALPKGAAITGRIVDEFGDPVASARVQALRYQLVQGTRRLQPVGVNAQTDDTGAFRLYGLMPGEYYVSATLRAFPFDETDDTTGYAPTYYPGTGSVTEAQRVSLAVGEEASISFGLMAVRTARVSGLVLNSQGGALAGGIIALIAADSGGPMQIAFGGNNRIRQDGSFTLTNVAPGTYTLMATNAGPGGGFGGRGGGPAADPELGTMPLTIANEDVTGITLVTGVGASLSGSVVAAQGSGKFSAERIQVITQPVPFERAQGPLGGRPARVDGDGTFTASGLFGSRLIRVNGLPQGWMLESVTVAGADVTDTPFDFGTSQEIRNARIVVTDKMTQVSGSVADKDGKSLRDFTVVVFPEDNTKWTAPSRYLQSGRPDQQGLFKIRGLPPNDRYLAVAVDYLEEGEGTDTEFLESIKNSATRFRLGRGESATVDLKLVER